MDLNQKHGSCSEKKRKYFRTVETRDQSIFKERGNSQRVNGKENLMTENSRMFRNKKERNEES